jgi:dipeptidyl aminopeptidase/acylaminoacyl peptidase
MLPVMLRTLGLLLCLALAAPAGAATFTATEMLKLKRLSDPQVSPDGKWVLYGITEVDSGTGARNADLWLARIPGGETRRLTNHPKSDTRGRFSPDGTKVAFVSSRDGTSQVYVVSAEGGEPTQVTKLPTGASGVTWIDAARLLVASDLYADCPDAECNRKKMEAAGKPSSARVYDELLYRHWDTWEDGRRSHLLVVNLAGGEARDLTPGSQRDVPPFSLGGPDDYAVSPDGGEVCFARNDDKVEATSTNAELYVVNSAGGEPKKIAGSPGYDGGPQYSPDGRFIAFRAQQRAGYESDRWRLMVYERQTGQTRSLTDAFDRHVEGFSWARDSKSLFLTASEQAREPIFTVPVTGGPVKKIADGSFSDVATTPDGKFLVAAKVSLTAPAEIVRLATNGSALQAITVTNDAFLKGFGLKPGESVSYTGAAGKSVQAWIVKPPSFDPAKRYPLLVLIHGGPQGAWNDGWSFRWNPQVFASAGYVVFAPNPRGSVGWGQEFVDDINGDWGGRAYEDIMKGTDYAEALPYVDKGRTVAAGASYGGYMVNWIAGHTDRFKALVSHDGVFDLASMYGATEELWFTDWEFRGPYWENPEMYARWSPSAFVKNFKTPTLVVHGELDYRVPLEQGLGMFTALQRKGVPSRLVIFPDENHWVLKPLNSVRWYDEVLGWLDRWAK